MLDVINLICAKSTSLHYFIQLEIAMPLPGAKLMAIAEISYLTQAERIMEALYSLFFCLACLPISGSVCKQAFNQSKLIYDIMIIC